MGKLLSDAALVLFVLFLLVPLPLAAWLQVRSARLSSTGFGVATAAIAVAMSLWAFSLVVMPMVFADLAFSGKSGTGEDIDPDPRAGWSIVACVVLLVVVATAVGALSFRSALRSRRTRAGTACLGRSRA